MFSVRPLPVMPTQQRTLVTPNHTACCSCLNSIAQPRPLPDGNHSPGTTAVNSSCTTELLLQFLTGQGDEPHLLFQGAQIMFPTTREVIDGHIRALLFKVSRYCFTAGEGVEAWGLVQVLKGSQVQRGDGQVEGRCQLGPGGQQVWEREQPPALLTFVQRFCVYKYLISSKCHTLAPRLH